MKRLLVSLVVLSGAVLESGFARATCCTTNADCPKGLDCNGGACSSDFVACMCDADCGPELFCLPSTSTVCTQTPGGGQDCHPQGQCVSAWQRPCFSTADCGPGGFTCAPDGGMLCDASGCQVTTRCMPPTLPSTCVTDADCPTSWTCEAGTVVTTSCIPIHENCPSGGCPPPSSAKGCVPPLFDLVGPPRFEGVPVAPDSSCPVKSGGGGAGGTGATASGGTGVQPAGATGGSGGREPPNAASFSGCQIAPARAGGSTLVLVCLGLTGLRLRRRPKRGGCP